MLSRCSAYSRPSTALRHTFTSAMCAALRHTPIVLPSRSLSFPTAWDDTDMLKDIQSSTEASPGVFELHNGEVRSFVLNRPKALNALSLDMIRFLHPRLKAYDNNDAVGLMVTSGQGNKAFCAGGDIVELYKNGQIEGGDTKTFFWEEYSLNHRISMLKTPYLALLNGITMGGGVGLSVHGRYRVAMESTIFAMPETGIGFFPDVGGSYFLPRLNGKLGMFLALTGHRLRGTDVFHSGVATHYIDSKSMLDLRQQLEQLYSAGERSIDAALEIVCIETKYLPPFSLANHLGVIDECFGQESVAKVIEKLEEFAGKAGPSAEFCASTLKKLRRMSPVSLMVTFRQVREGETKSMEECFKMEFRISQGFMRSRDFFEGVRSLLIDKDNRPKWEHASVSEVPEALVDGFFELHEGNEDLLLGHLDPDRPEHHVRTSEDYLMPV